MKTIHDKSTLVHYYEEFAEFLAKVENKAVIEAIAKNGGHSWRHEPGKFADGGNDMDMEWAGGLTHGAANELASTGMTLDKDALEIREQINTEMKPMLAECFCWDVTGGMVDVGAFLSGEPECMMTTREDTTRARKVVNILFNGSVSCGVGEKIMRLRGIAMLAFVDALESTQRYRVNLYYSLAFGRSSSDNAKGAVVIRLLDPSHRYDPQAVGYALTHPTMFRRLVFSYLNTLDEATAATWGVNNSNYGFPGTLRSLPTEIEDGTFASSECLHCGIQRMSEVYNTKSAIEWVKNQMSQLTVDAMM